MIDEIKRFKQEIPPNAHSNWIAFKDGEVTSEGMGRVCYYALFKKKEINTLFLFFGKNSAKSVSEALKWCTWIINDSFYAPAFVTKSAEEGFENGFEINMEEDVALVKAACIALRHPFEYKNWSWYKFLKLGFDEYESYALASNVDVYNSFITKSLYNCNHLVIQRNSNLELYMGKHFKPKNFPAEESLIIDSKLSTEHFGCKNLYEYEIDYYLLDDLVEFTKNHCDKILNYLKGC